MVAQAGRNGEADAQWYLRQRQLWRLTPRQIEAYRRLTTWREGETRARNLPRGWLVHDRVLYAIAEAMPENRYELAQVEEVKPGLAERDGDTRQAQVAAARHRDEAALPPAPPSPMAAELKRVLTARKKVVNAVA